MEFQSPYPELIAGGYASILHFSWTQGLSKASLQARVNDGALPPLPKHLDINMGGTRVWAEQDVHTWALVAEEWKASLPARRAAARAEAKARQEWLFAQAAAKLDAETAWGREQAATRQTVIEANERGAEDRQRLAEESGARTVFASEMAARANR